MRWVNIVVLQADDRHFGLVVDEINDTEEIVVKPLGKQLKGIPTFAGATIMGDGQVALILDVLGLAQRANVVSEVRDRSVGEKTAEAGSGTTTGNRSCCWEGRMMGGWPCHCLSWRAWKSSPVPPWRRRRGGMWCSIAAKSCP